MHWRNEGGRMGLAGSWWILFSIPDRIDVRPARREAREAPADRAQYWNRDVKLDARCQIPVN